MGREVFLSGLLTQEWHQVWPWHKCPDETQGLGQWGVFQISVQTF